MFHLFSKLLTFKSYYLRTMKSIVLLGAGNVATHLCKAIHNSLDFKVIQVYNRNEKSLTFFPSALDKTSSLTEIKEADIYIIAVPDDAIVLFSESLAIKSKLVVHTSGSVTMEALSDKNRKGVLYPLQSFSKNSKVDFSEIPMCIEAQNESDLGLLNQLGNSISNNVLAISSEKREKIHLSAVIVNNFVNYLYQVGNDLMQEQSLSFDLLKPLILETANKINTLSPAEAQTGPAKRNDKKTIEKQLHLLKDSPYKDIYQDITNSILKKYNNH
ncbi:MAG: putative short-subunit dehydrogenase-like oxidoreductase (DUF2520 family) [bacterium]|jgi:predicted short-subunit dehydrogenase-like oxidoreductase (DUF2520 family)